MVLASRNGWIGVQSALQTSCAGNAPGSRAWFDAVLISAEI
jgi:hypothetical protein